MAQMVKNPPAMQETQVQSLGREDPLERGMSTHSRIYGLPCSSEGKESAYSARDLVSIPEMGRSPEKREWLPTPVFLPGESHGQRSLVGHSSWSCKGSDTTE